MSKNHSWGRHITACNSVIDEVFIPWLINDQAVGWLRPNIVNACIKHKNVFRLSDECLHFTSELNDFKQRSQALEEVACKLAEDGVINPLMGELYPVIPAEHEQVFCTIDRSAGAFFGIRAFGQHLNGYVRRSDGIHMWIARRARDRLIFPGALDNMVAGGLPYDLSLADNIQKEGAEEATLPIELTRDLVPISVVTYNRVAKYGFRPDVIYCYDLELPQDFVPHNTDGEVEAFMLLPIQEVARLVRETDEFKLNCNLVIIDFMLRHGYIEAQDPEYLALSVGLRQPLGMPN